MSEKIVLIDGHSILNRAFYGVPDLTNSEGLHTNAVYGFLNIMFKILEEEKPEYLTVAFDVHAPTFRHEMFAEYKGTRKPMADELRQQVPVIKEVLQAMGVKTIEKAGLEADDLLGTLAKRCEEMGMEVSVISGDRDLLQLATEHVKIRIPKTKQGKTEIEDYYAADVQERIQSAMEQKIKDKRHRLSLYLERFHGLSPLRKLNQGYSYVSDKEGKTLTSVSQVKQGDGLLIYVTDGTIEASVQNTKASSYGADTDSEK